MLKTLDVSRGSSDCPARAMNVIASNIAFRQYAGRSQRSCVVSAAVCRVLRIKSRRRYRPAWLSRQGRRGFQDDCQTLARRSAGGREQQRPLPRHQSVDEFADAVLASRAYEANVAAIRSDAADGERKPAIAAVVGPILTG